MSDPKLSLGLQLQKDNAGGGGGSNSFPAGGVEVTKIEREPKPDGNINYVVLASCKDNTSHKDNGEVQTWAELIKVIGTQLEKWIDHDGYDVQIIAISATRNPIEPRRST
jgi:hypothetical protein